MNEETELLTTVTKPERKKECGKIQEQEKENIRETSG
jgi:hypothetical protein